MNIGAFTGRELKLDNQWLRSGKISKNMEALKIVALGATTLISCGGFVAIINVVHHNKKLQKENEIMANKERFAMESLKAQEDYSKSLEFANKELHRSLEKLNKEKHGGNAGIAESILVAMHYLQDELKNRSDASEKLDDLISEMEALKELIERENL